MDIEVGEYIRTSKGNIFYNLSSRQISGLKLLSQQYGIIIKHSKNIIDLIEEGDYVNGRKIERINDYGEHKRADFNLDFDDCDAVYNEDIKTILTHEQYEINSYRLEG